MDKNEIKIDYKYDIIEDIKPINQEIWAVFKSDEFWWAKRCIGICKVLTSPYTSNLNLNYEQARERIIIYDLCYFDMEDSQIQTISFWNNNFLGLVYDRPPTEKDVKDFIATNNLDKRMIGGVVSGEIIK